MDSTLIVPQTSDSTRSAVAGVILLGVAVAAIRLTGPPDLMDNEQQLQSAYVMDALQNGHWICQHDETGAIASKPPVYTWLAALATLPSGRINRLSMCLPSILGTIGLALLLHRFGRKYFGAAAGLLAAAVYLLSYCGARQVGMERMDGLLPLTTTVTSVAAFAAWRRGQGWIWFWLAAAVSTLTKTPVALLLGPAGLIGLMGERRGALPVRNRKRNHLENTAGVLLFLFITLGWLVAAGAVMGAGPVYHKLILDELLNQSVQEHKGVWPGQHFYEAPFYLITRFLPWSLLACVNLWRCWESPAREEKERQFERFVGSWMVVGLLPFCILSHVRADIVSPLYAPAALLAGRELALWLGSLRGQWRAAILTGGAVTAMAALALKYNYMARNSVSVTTTLAVRDFAGSIEQTVGPEFPLTHVDDPYAVQFYLNTMRPAVSYATAAQLLKGDAAAFVAVCQPELLDLADSPWGGQVYELAKTPSIQKQPCTHILSNRPALRAESRMAMAVGALEIRTDGLLWLHAAERDFAFSGQDSATFTNTGDRPVKFRVVLENADGIERVLCILQPDEFQDVVSGRPTEARADMGASASFHAVSVAKANPG
jgi:4-amino-4-deoxy-L-arabinose transferase-like glycosyltransferase